MEGIRQTRTFNKIGSVLSDRAKTLNQGAEGKLRPKGKEGAVCFDSQDVHKA